jgi:hypothetical protein
MSDAKRDVPDDGKLHGPEIDEALDWAETHTAPFLGLCETALWTRTDQIVDAQIKYGTDPANVEEAKKALLDAGAPFDADTAAGVVIRSTVGGTFTMGLAAGIRLAAMMTPDRLDELVAAPGEES